MALGTPVVASRVGGIPEVLKDGEEGLLAEPGDVESLASAIGRLVDDRVYRQELSRRALERVRSGFDVAVLGLRMQELLLEAGR
jgi:glycosyltransferase involved in cell wall biosynthesis